MEFVFTTLLIICLFSKVICRSNYMCNADTLLLDIYVVSTLSLNYSCNYTSIISCHTQSNEIITASR
jgi:hypothetical protein